jgi:hypothetical protein
MNQTQNSRITYQLHKFISVKPRIYLYEIRMDKYNYVQG